MLHIDMQIIAGECRLALIDLSTITLITVTSSVFIVKLVYILLSNFSFKLKLDLHMSTSSLLSYLQEMDHQKWPRNCTELLILDEITRFHWFLMVPHDPRFPQKVRETYWCQSYKG